MISRVHFLVHPRNKKLLVVNDLRVSGKMG
jgi:hypothetical protein